MSTGEHVSLASFTLELRNVVYQTFETDLKDQRYKTLNDFLDSILTVNAKNFDENNPANIIRIDRSKIADKIRNMIRIDRSKIADQIRNMNTSLNGQTNADASQLPDIEYQLSSYLSVIEKKLDALKRNHEPKETFLDRYGAMTYLMKIFLMVSVLVSFLKITWEVQRVQSEISRVNEDMVRQKQAELNARDKFIVRQAAVNQTELLSKQQELEQIQRSLQEAERLLGELQRSGQAASQEARGLAEQIQQLNQAALIYTAAINDLRKQLGEKTALIQQKNANVQRMQADIDDLFKELGACSGLQVCPAKVNVTQGQLQQLKKQVKTRIENCDGFQQENLQLKQENARLKAFEDAYNKITKLFPDFVQVSID